jgi:hypothetical protein
LSQSKTQLGRESLNLKGRGTKEKGTDERGSGDREKKRRKAAAVVGVDKKAGGAFFLIRPRRSRQAVDRKTATARTTKQTYTASKRAKQYDFKTEMNTHDMYVLMLVYMCIYSCDTTAYI